MTSAKDRTTSATASAVSVAVPVEASPEARQRVAERVSAVMSGRPSEASPCPKCNGKGEVLLATAKSEPTTVRCDACYPKCRICGLPATHFEEGIGRVCGFEHVAKRSTDYAPLVARLRTYSRAQAPWAEDAAIWIEKVIAESQKRSDP